MKSHVKTTEHKKRQILHSERVIQIFRCVSSCCCAYLLNTNGAQRKNSAEVVDSKTLPHILTHKITTKADFQNHTFPSSVVHILTTSVASPNWSSPAETNKVIKTVLLLHAFPAFWSPHKVCFTKHTPKFHPFGPSGRQSGWSKTTSEQ